MTQHKKLLISSDYILYHFNHQCKTQGVGQAHVNYWRIALKEMLENISCERIVPACTKYRWIGSNSTVFVLNDAIFVKKDKTVA